MTIFNNLYLIDLCNNVSFSVLTLLVGLQEGHPPYYKLVPLIPKVHCKWRNKIKEDRITQVHRENGRLKGGRQVCV